jgi:hypothetical protein
MDVLPPLVRERVSTMPFQLLHASRLQFRHPIKETVLELTAPIRQEMVEFQEILENAFL